MATINCLLLSLNDWKIFFEGDFGYTFLCRSYSGILCWQHPVPLTLLRGRHYDDCINAADFIDRWHSDFGRTQITELYRRNLSDHYRSGRFIRWQPEYHSVTRVI